MKRLCFLYSTFALLVFSAPAVLACDSPASVCDYPTNNHFVLIKNQSPVVVLSDTGANSAVRRAAASFAEDLERVSGRPAKHIEELKKLKGPAVVIGVAGDSPLIDELILSGKVDVEGLRDKWEGFQISVVDNPWPKVPKALLIIGSDRRGSVFGTYDLSESIGVSPWYWFADVPVKRKKDVYVTAGTRLDWPKVRYRGIFINDEDPGLSSWATNRFGGVNSGMYEHVFELILRLKGNYLWPAMWYPKSFHLDDPQNKVLADSMGIVMGTSHHEPLTRAQSEWHRIENGTTGGAWDYQANTENLRAFWRGGMTRLMSKGDDAGYENVVTVGMRGDGDMPMSDGTAIGLLETIVADQRKIIAEVTGQPAEKTPQVWALYKEVQDYYDQGMTVPDDITLLFADDNWGQIRRLPMGDLDRSGGYGVYYHFDYVGVPRNYKWLNTQQIQKVWQQMNLAYERGARSLWVVNVGDIKPLEYPMDFFLKMAWNPEDMTHKTLETFPEKWAARTFNKEIAKQVAELVSTYSRLASRRTPELLNESTFPVGPVSPALDGQEFGEIVAEWRALVSRLKITKKQIEPAQQAAFFQLVEFPIMAFSNLYELYYATAWNRRLASHHDPRANYFIPIAQQAFARDAELTKQYHALEDGKWDGMMNQVHMNYVIWNEPMQQTLPPLTRVAADAPIDKHEMKIVFTDTPVAKVRALTIPAAQFSRASTAQGINWTAIPHLGQAGAAMVALPQGMPPTTAEDGIKLEYDFNQSTDGQLLVEISLSPTLDTRNLGGIRLGVSVNDAPVKTVRSSLEPTAGGIGSSNQADWVQAVSNNIHTVNAVFDGLSAGKHTLKLWRMDDNIVIEKVMLTTF